MTKVQPFSRITSGQREINTLPDASLPPRMQHLLRKRRARPTERQQARKAQAVGEARRNDTVALVRSLATPSRKRGGARYGPALKLAPVQRMQAPKPMLSAVRREIYLAGRGLAWMTGRQHRQYCRMALRGGDANTFRIDGKGRPTPKRGAR